MGRVWALTLMWSLKHIVGLNYRVIGARKHSRRARDYLQQTPIGLGKLWPCKFSATGSRGQKRIVQTAFFGWGLKLAKTIGIDRSNRAQANAQINGTRLGAQA